MGWFRRDEPIVKNSTDPFPPYARHGRVLVHRDTRNSFKWVGDKTGGVWEKVARGGHEIVIPSAHHTPGINRLFHNHLGSPTALAVAAVTGDTTITVDDATGIVNGDALQFGLGLAETSHPRVVGAPAGNIVQLDRPLDNPHAVGTQIERVNSNMAIAVGGTVNSPVIFTIEPGPKEVWKIARILLAIEAGGAMDDSLFGAAAALTNGVLIRGRYNGTYRTVTNWKKNGEIGLDVYDRLYTDKAGPGATGLTARGTFTKVGISPMLDGSTGDRLEVLIQDPMATNTSIEMKAQGYLDA
jgi:hypothetical protein